MLIDKYCELDPKVGRLILLAKHWARVCIAILALEIPHHKDNYGYPNFACFRRLTWTTL